ncbi:MAG TPA: polyprenol monophosphomannose synthase [Candidatus Kapabacteria bacterium]|nr:polyprenol monophosphomannose synthase [Candidatus Kapabacteria bacterium]
MPRALIIIPTYNEQENIVRIVHEVFAQQPLSGDVELNILIVDDNSPDGTSEIVREMQKREDPQFTHIHLLTRPGKMGLGTAYVTGFKYGLAEGYEYIFEMDADFSHDPKEIPKFLHEIQNYDLVIGSRYIPGAHISNWPRRRLLLSYNANLYARMITGIPVRDATAGFKCFRRKVLEAIDLDDIRSNGYAFQIEMHFRAWRKGFRIKEIPITFTDRDAGTSKMSRAIVREAAGMVWKLKARSISGEL